MTDAPRITITVLYRLDGTTKTDTFTADRASSQQWSSGKALLTLTNGRDAKDQPVTVAHYRHADRITY